MSLHAALCWFGGLVHHGANAQRATNTRGAHVAGYKLVIPASTPGRLKLDGVEQWPAKTCWDGAFRTAITAHVALPSTVPSQT